MGGGGKNSSGRGGVWARLPRTKGEKKKRDPLKARHVKNCSKTLGRVDNVQKKGWSTGGEKKTTPHSACQMPGGPKGDAVCQRPRGGTKRPKKGPHKKGAPTKAKGAPTKTSKLKNEGGGSPKGG